MHSTSVICVAGLKGGTGKTTSAVLLAAAWHRRGLRVALIDADPQRSATHWRAASAPVGQDASADLPTVVAVDAAAIGPTMQDLARAYDVLIIDTPARLAQETRRALLATGKLGGIALVPMSASGVDLRATLQTAELVREAQDFRPELRAAVLRNRWNARLRIAADVDVSMGALALPVLSGTLAQRTAYAEAVSHGLAIEDLDDQVAQAELSAVLEELQSQSMNQEAA